MASSVPNNGSDVDPAMAGSLAGSFVVAWDRVFFGTPGAPNDGGGIHVRRFDADGTATGSEITIAGASYRYPRLALNALGDGVLVWESFEPGGLVVRAQRLARDGALSGAEIVVEPDGGAPQVAIDDSGDFVVAWETSKETVIPLGAYSIAPVDSSTVVRVRRYHADGTPKAAASVVASAVVFGQSGGRPIGPQSVAATGDGRHVLSWLDPQYRPVTFYFDASGRALNRGQRLTVSASRAQVNEPAPSVLSADGSLTVVFRNLNATTPNAILTQRFSASGALGNPDVIDDAAGAQDTGTPALASLASGRSVAVWQWTGRNAFEGSPPPNELRGRVLASAGTAEGSLFRFSTASSATQPGVAPAGPDRMAASWLESGTDPATGRFSSRVHARLLSAN